MPEQIESTAHTEPFYVVELGTVDETHRETVVNRLMDQVADPVLAIPLATQFAARILLGQFSTPAPDGPQPIEAADLVNILPSDMGMIINLLNTKISSVILPHQKVSYLQPKFEYVRETISPHETLNGFSHYLHKISKTALLRAEQEVELAQQIEAGTVARNKLATPGSMSQTKKTSLEQAIDVGDQARLAFIKANLLLVVSVAKKYQNQGLEFEDLIQAGNEKLTSIVPNWDYKLGFKFSSFATIALKRGYDQVLGEESRAIRLPVRKFKKFTLLNNLRRELSIERGGVEPKDEELAHLMDMTPDAIHELDSFKDAVHLDAIVSEEACAKLEEDEAESEELPGNGDYYGRNRLASVFIDQAEPVEEQVYRGMMRTAVQDMLAGLTDRERTVIEMRYGINPTTIGLNVEEPMTYEEIGKDFNLTKQRIYQIERDVLTKLRHPNFSSHLREYLY